MSMTTKVPMATATAATASTTPSTTRRIRAAFSPIWSPLPRIVTSPRQSPLRAPTIITTATRPTKVPLRLSAAGAEHRRNPTNSQSAPTTATTTTSSETTNVENSGNTGSVTFQLFGRTIGINPRFALLLVPFLWGSLPPVYKLRLKLPWALTAAVFNASRLLLSFMFLAPTAIRDVRSKSSDTPNLLGAGAELGLWTFLASTLQLLGVRYTSASRAAFLTQLQTVFVPLIAACVGDPSGLSKHTLIASTVALAGVACLTLDSAAAPLTLAGDGTMILVALIAATLIIRNRDLAVKLRSGPLVAYKVGFQMLYAFIFMGMSAIYMSMFGGGTAAAAAAAGGGIASWFAGCTPVMLLLNLGLVIWSGLFVNAGSTWLHIKGNTVVPAAESAIIFSFTPLWASVFAVFLGERFGFKGMIGAVLIVLSTVLASRSPAKRKQVDATPS